MASALAQLDELNGLFRSGLQPIHDYNSGRLALAQVENERRYRENQRQLARTEGRDDEAYLFGLQKGRQAKAARSTLAQLGKSPTEIAALDDDQAVFLAGELARQHQITSDAHTRIGIDRDKQAKTARATLKQLEVDSTPMSDDEAIFKAGIEQAKAEQRARVAVQGEMTAPQLSEMTAALRAAGDLTPRSPEATRDAYNQLNAQRSVEIRSAQQATASTIQDSIEDIQARLSRLGAGFDRSAALAELLRGQKTKSGSVIGPNTNRADIEAHWSSLSPKERGATEMKLTMAEDDFNKAAPALERTLGNELIRARGNLTELAMKGIVPGVRKLTAPAAPSAPQSPSGAPPNPLQFLQSSGKVGASSARAATVSAETGEYGGAAGAIRSVPRFIDGVTLSARIFGDPIARGYNFLTGGLKRVDEGDAARDSSMDELLFRLGMTPSPRPAPVAPAEREYIVPTLY